MERPINYRTKSLKQLLEAYAFENDRTNREDAETTQKFIVNEICVRVKSSFDFLDKGASVESVYRQLIEP